MVGRSDPQHVGDSGVGILAKPPHTM